MEGRIIAVLLMTVVKIKTLEAKTIKGFIF